MDHPQEQGKGKVSLRTTAQASVPSQRSHMPEIPGYFYDPARNRYFKQDPNSHRRKKAKSTLQFPRLPKQQRYSVRKSIGCGSATVLQPQSLYQLSVARQLRSSFSFDQRYPNLKMDSSMEVLCPFVFLSY